jgi:excisionase family DNA binding protein
MRITQQKEIFTTGEVARICHVAPRTVSKWFDTGKLRGYRIPGSRDRRIPRNQLVAFMRAHEIPMDGLDLGICRVLAVDPDLPGELVDAMNGSNQYQVRSAANEFEAGVLAQQFRPHVIVLRVTGEPQRAKAFCQDIKSTNSLSSAKVIAAVGGEGNGVRAELLSVGFDEVLGYPFSVSQLVQAVEDATNLIT